MDDTSSTRGGVCVNTVTDRQKMTVLCRHKNHGSPSVVDKYPLYVRTQTTIIWSELISDDYIQQTLHDILTALPASLLWLLTRVRKSLFLSPDRRNFRANLSAKRILSLQPPHCQPSSVTAPSLWFLSHVQIFSSRSEQALATEWLTTAAVMAYANAVSRQAKERRIFILVYGLLNK